MWHSEPYACHGCFEDDIQSLFGCGVQQKRVMSSEREKGPWRRLRPTCSSVTRRSSRASSGGTFGPDTATCHSILSKFAQASFSRSLRRLKVVLGWAAHDPMGPTIWDESAEFEAVEEISAEVVVHVDSVAEETENCNIHVWSGLTHVLRAGGHWTISTRSERSSA